MGTPPCMLSELFQISEVGSLFNLEQLLRRHQNYSEPEFGPFQRHLSKKYSEKHFFSSIFAKNLRVCPLKHTNNKIGFPEVVLFCEKGNLKIDNIHHPFEIFILI